ncbi:ATP-binding protein [Nonomuraea dietziae]|uniref:ATP-binding protein n=1 Tax=Nonomuraea dietziae TaxID=65515 RepID=UPI0031E0A11D
MVAPGPRRPQGSPSRRIVRPSTCPTWSASRSDGARSRSPRRAATTSGCSSAGTGKTLLAERLPTLLPDLDVDQALEVTAIHSIAGVLPSNSPMMSRPAVREPAPHGERRLDRRRR